MLILSQRKENHNLALQDALFPKIYGLSFHPVMQKYVYVIKYEQNLEFDRLPGVKMNSLQRISKKIKKTFHHVCHQIGYSSQTVLDYAKLLSLRQLLSLLFVIFAFGTILTFLFLFISLGTSLGFAFEMFLFLFFLPWTEIGEGKVFFLSFIFFCCFCFCFWE